MEISVRKTLFNELIEKLKDVGVYKYIDLDKAQLDRQSETYPHCFPCAFINIKNISYEDMTLDCQEGKVTIDFLLFFDKYGDTFEGAVDQTKSLEILDILDKTVKEIQWTENEPLYTKLTQIGEEDLTQRYKRPAYKLSFSTLIYNDLNTDTYVSRN